MKLLDDWLALWNGDYGVADRALAADFTVHAALLDGGSELHGRDAMVGWIEQTRAAFAELEFRIEVGPIAGGDHVALRWVATGTYGGGFAGATAAAGTPVRFTGTDILRVSGGELAEYWVNSDVHVLLTQLGVTA
jgi:predicted ester cyclase